MRVESESIRDEKRKAIKEYEIKIEKAELQIKAIRKNMELVELQLDEYQEKNFSIREKLREAVQNNASQSSINELESITKQYDLAIESGQLNLETYTKDIDILKNNIEFFGRQIRKLQ
jgi:flagellar biosynthesis chaperone FliJ